MEEKQNTEETTLSTENNNMDKAHVNKWRSRKWFVTLWCMFMVTGIVSFSYITGDNQFVMLATTLAAEPIAYMSIQSIVKNKNKGNSHTDEAR